MTNNDFELQLDRYADLLISWALNIQEGQNLNIMGEPAHRYFCGKLVKRAYEKGAKHVNVFLQAPEFVQHRVEKTVNDEHLCYVPNWLTNYYNEIVDTEGAMIRLVGPEDPDILAHLDPKKVNCLQLSFKKALKRYYEEGIFKSKIAWNVAAHPTEAWAKKLYPELTAKDALEALWKDIFKICRVDREDYIEAWETHNEDLKRRATYLDNQKIKSLHFVGPGTDLRVFLSPEATFLGGTSMSTRNVRYEPNIPTEECFTTPDFRKTEGRVNVTRPVFVNGKLIKGLKLVFKNGEVVSFEAEEGRETFQEYINSDEGAKRLGEVALVGCDSPIFQSKKVFQEILLDENAACHIAVGSAYTFCIKDGAKKSREELDALGCNQSSCHLDMMISNEEVDVTVETYDDKIFTIIKKGYWVI